MKTGEAFFSLLNLVSPPVCAACGEGTFQNEAVCCKCKAKVVQFSAPCCHKCGISLAPGVSRICGNCAKKKREYAFAIPACPYDGIVRDLILALKLRRHTSAAPMLADLIMQAIVRDTRIQSDFLVVPIPVSRLCFRNRGYNQAELIARHLAKEMCLELSTDALVKIRETPRQDELSRLYRLSNLRGAFAVRRNIGNRNILLVDDVLTTGSTADECARTLKAAGAASVAVACVAYTLPGHHGTLSPHSDVYAEQAD